MSTWSHPKGVASKDKNLGLSETYLSTSKDKKLGLWLKSYSNFYKIVFFFFFCGVPLGVTPRELPSKTKFLILISPILWHLKINNWTWCGWKVIKMYFFSVVPPRDSYGTQIVHLRTELFTIPSSVSNLVSIHTHRKSFLPRDRWRNITPRPLGLFV